MDEKKCSVDMKVKWTDHSPCQYDQYRNATLLLGLSEYIDLRYPVHRYPPYQYDWLRLATCSEIQKEISLIQERNDIDELQVCDGQEYVWVTVLQNAPGHIWRQSTSHLRLKAFKDEG